MPIVTAAAVPTSASANTTAGLLPPSSRLTRLHPTAAAIMTFCPTARLPVNDSLSRHRVADQCLSGRARRDR